MGWRATPGGGKQGHWASLEVDPDGRCPWGIRRYCCSPTAWRNGVEDFGDAYYGEGGWLGWAGEPLDERLCVLADRYGLDPHDVWNHGDMNYKPHKPWFAGHVADVVNTMRAQRATAAIRGS